MSKRLTSTVIFFLTLSYYGWSQTQADITPFKLDCPERGLSQQLDSVETRLAIDSVASLISGRWQLVETHHDAANPIRRPSDLIEMKLDNQGNGVTYRNGQTEVVFQLSISLHYGFFRFTTGEEGRRFFYLGPPSKRSPLARGSLTVCQQGLMIHSLRSSAIVFIFKPIISPQLKSR